MKCDVQWILIFGRSEVKARRFLALSPWAADLNSFEKPQPYRDKPPVSLVLRVRSKGEVP